MQIELNMALVYAHRMSGWWCVLLKRTINTCSCYPPHHWIIKIHWTNHYYNLLSIHSTCFIFHPKQSLLLLPLLLALRLSNVIICIIIMSPAFNIFPIFKCYSINRSIMIHLNTTITETEERIKGEAFHNVRA